MGQYKNQNDAIEAVLRRSAVDADFRHKLLADPVGGVEEITGKQVGLRVRFVEKPKDVDAIYVLPDTIDQASLSAAELEVVSGGATADATCSPDIDPDACSVTCTLSCGCTGGSGI